MNTTIHVSIRREANGTVEEHSRTIPVPSTGNPRFVAFDLRRHAPSVLDAVIRDFGDPDIRPAE
jgi:hypothetical protein